MKKIVHGPRGHTGTKSTCSGPATKRFQEALGGVGNEGPWVVGVQASCTTRSGTPVEPRSTNVLHSHSRRCNTTLVTCCEAFCCKKPPFKGYSRKCSLPHPSTFLNVGSRPLWTPLPLRPLLAPITTLERVGVAALTGLAVSGS